MLHGKKACVLSCMVLVSRLAELGYEGLERGKRGSLVVALRRLALFVVVLGGIVLAAPVITATVCIVLHGLNDVGLDVEDECVVGFERQDAICED